MSVALAWLHWAQYTSVILLLDDIFGVIERPALGCLGPVHLPYTQIYLGSVSGLYIHCTLYIVQCTTGLHWGQCPVNGQQEFRKSHLQQSASNAD